MTYNKLHMLLTDRRYAAAEKLVKTNVSSNKMSSVRYKGDLPIVIVMKNQGPESLVLALLHDLPQCALERDEFGKTLFQIAKECGCTRKILREIAEVKNSTQEYRQEQQISLSDKSYASPSNVTHSSSEDLRTSFRSQESVKMSTFRLKRDDKDISPSSDIGDRYFDERRTYFRSKSMRALPRLNDNFEEMSPHSDTIDRYIENTRESFISQRSVRMSSYHLTEGDVRMLPSRRNVLAPKRLNSQLSSRR